MKVSGTATLHGTPEQVYAALNDPAVLVRTIPGCEQLEALAPDRYRMTVTAGVASIKGSYLGDVVLADPAPPSAFTLKASGSGAPGTVSADVKVRLEAAADGTTLLSYDADAVVGGAVGGVGQRVLTGVARKTAGEFFSAVDAVLRAGGLPVEETPAPAAALAAPAVTGATPAAPAAGQVFTRPEAALPAADSRTTTVAFLFGALVALAGVWVGYRIARRRD